MPIEEPILTNLLHNDEFSRKVIPFIKPEYFEERNERILFEEYTKLFLTYNNVPNPDMIANEVFNRKDLFENDHKSIQDKVSELKENNPVNET